MPHKFKVGDIVRVSRSPNAPGGAYEVVRRLPENANGEFEYQIKSHTEPHVRVARESDLSET